MLFDFPRPLTGNTARDVAQLWEDVWKTVEKLSLNEQARADAAKKEDKLK